MESYLELRGAVNVRAGPPKNRSAAFARNFAAWICQEQVGMGCLDTEHGCLDGFKNKSLVAAPYTA